MKQRITTSIVKQQAMGATQVSGLALMEMAQSLLVMKERQTRNQGCGKSTFTDLLA
jgi:predicted double-glycine peptidase